MYKQTIAISQVDSNLVARSTLILIINGLLLLLVCLLILFPGAFGRSNQDTVQDVHSRTMQSSEKQNVRSHRESHVMVDPIGSPRSVMKSGDRNKVPYPFGIARRVAESFPTRSQGGGLDETLLSALSIDLSLGRKAWSDISGIVAMMINGEEVRIFDSKQLVKSDGVTWSVKGGEMSEHREQIAEVLGLQFGTDRARVLADAICVEFGSDGRTRKYTATGEKDGRIRVTVDILALDGNSLMTTQSVMTMEYFRTRFPYVQLPD